MNPQQAVLLAERKLFHIYFLDYILLKSTIIVRPYKHQKYIEPTTQYSAVTTKFMICNLVILLQISSKLTFLISVTSSSMTITCHILLIPKLFIVPVRKKHHLDVKS